MKISKFGLLMCAVLLPIEAIASVLVSHYETLQPVVAASPEKGRTGFAPQQRESAMVSLSFDALGRRFDLDLEINERIAAAAAPAIAAHGIKVYRGQISGNADSWARIVMLDEIPRGLIWDGNELFAVEAPGDSAVAADAPVIYRLADAYIAPGTMSCGSDSLSGNAAAVLNKLQTAAKAAIARAPGAVSEITMSAIGDYEFTSARGGDAAAAAAISTRLNNVDGYFSSQVGVQISVLLIETHNDPLDPFGDTTDSNSLLTELSEYRLQTPAHNAYGLTHLYTGRDLDSSTVGIAWRGALCDNYFSAGLSEGNTGAVFDSLIAAHEIGHNFNAEHDGEPGTPCVADTGQFIMSPTVSGSTVFSDCSISIMQAEAASASCVVALPTVDVSISADAGQSTDVLLGVSTDFDYTVSSNGTLQASSVMADFTLPSVLTFDAVTTTAGTCSSGAGTVSCDLGDLAGQSSSSITITATPTSTGSGTLDAIASTTSSDERPTNNQESLQLTVNPAVDLVTGVPTSAPVFIDASTVVSATFDNVSTLDASNVTVTVNFDIGLRPDSANWSIGTCTVSGQQVNCSAGNFAAQSNASLSIGATGVSAGRKDVTISLSSTEADADPSNNSAQGEVRVVTQNDNSDDSGGGAGAWLLLLLLTARVLPRRGWKSLH